MTKSSDTTESERQKKEDSKMGSSHDAVVPIRQSSTSSIQQPPQQHTQAHVELQEAHTNPPGSGSGLGLGLGLGLGSDTIIMPPTTITNPIISSNTTPINSGLTTPNSEAIFKIPKKIIVSNSSSVHHPDTSTAAPSNAGTVSAGSPSTNDGTVSEKLNKTAINNLNKSLQAKQKFISTNTAYPKNSSIISEILNTSPLMSLFPGNVSERAEEGHKGESQANNSVTSSASAVPNSSSTGSVGVVAPATEDPSSAEPEDPIPLPPAPEQTPKVTKDKGRKLNTQTSTRTDFFAAKLASAVDDVDSSDSDETFVYENNVPSYESNNNNANNNSTNNNSNNNSNNNNSTTTTNNNNNNTNTNNLASGNFGGSMGIDSPRTEEMSNNGSIINAPGALSSPPILDQHYDDHNNTINSISTIPSEFNHHNTLESENIKAQLLNNNSNEEVNKEASEEESKVKDISIEDKPKINSNQTQPSLPVTSGTHSTATTTYTIAPEGTSAPQTSSDHPGSAAAQVPPAPPAHTHSFPNTSNTSTISTASAASPSASSPFPLIEIPAIGTSTPLIGGGKTDSIQSLRSIKFPKASTQATSKLPVNNNESSNVATISGKERPQTQRSNSIYSMSHPSLKGNSSFIGLNNNNAASTTNNNNDEKLQHPFNDHSVETHTHVQDSPNGSTIAVDHSIIHPLHNGAYFDTRSSYQPSRAGTSINETFTNEDRYSSDDMDEDAEVIDNVGSDGEFYENGADPDSTINGNTEQSNSSQNNTQAPHSHQSTSAVTTPHINGPSYVGGSVGPSIDTMSNLNSSNTNLGGGVGTNSITSKSTRKNKSTTSSKLRSTTSKLFDKKGSQPRRYSIIPDDIDIEDFDDELIYYDNNIRFPYSSIGANSQTTSNHNNLNNNNNNNNNNHNNNNDPQYNENSPLIGDVNVGGIPGRIPHYRSLNLNQNNGKKATNAKSKRFLSSGQVFGNGLGVSETQASEDEGKVVFPFPYLDQNQQHAQQPYYYNFDEYDEEFHSDGVENNHLNTYGRKANRNFSGYHSGGAGGHPQLSASNGHFFLPRKKSNSTIKNQRVNCIKSFIYTLISILTILSVGFIMGFVLATTKELTHVSILSIDNTLVSSDELVFNIVVEAFNPGWFAVEIQEVELDIFAKSGYLPDPNEGNGGDDEGITTNAIETVLLGSVLNLESPMSFRGGFFNRESIKQVSEIKLLQPGKNLSIESIGSIHTLGNTTDPKVPDNSKKWEIIAKNPFDMIIRGLLKYKLPLTKNTKSVVVKLTSFVDPNA